jgi:hypothetical protein
VRSVSPRSVNSAILSAATQSLRLVAMFIVPSPSC